MVRIPIKRFFRNHRFYDSTVNGNIKSFLRNHTYEYNTKKEFYKFENVIRNDKSIFKENESYIDDLIYKGYVTNPKLIEYMSCLSESDLETMHNNNLYINFYTRFEPTGLNSLTNNDQQSLNTINKLVCSILHNESKDTLINNFKSSTFVTIQKKLFNKLIQHCIKNKYKDIANRKYLQFIRDIIKNNVCKLALEYFSEIYNKEYSNNTNKIKTITEAIKDKELSKYINYNLHKMNDFDYSGNSKLEDYDDDVTSKANKNILQTINLYNIINLPAKHNTYSDDCGSNYEHFKNNFDNVFKEICTYKNVWCDENQTYFVERHKERIF